MKTPRIDALDLRDPAAVRQAELDLAGWWTDWDNIEWFPPRRRPGISMRALSEAISRLTMSMFAVTPGFKTMLAAAADAEAQQLRLRAILGTKPRRPWWALWR